MGCQALTGILSVTASHFSQKFSDVVAKCAEPESKSSLDKLAKCEVAKETLGLGGVRSANT